MNHESKNGMATRDVPCLAVHIFSDEVANRIFMTTSGYLPSVVNGIRYLSKSSKENVLSTTITIYY